MEPNISKRGIDLSVCAYCLAPLNEYDRTVDHLIPESRGGIRSNDNKLPSCLVCNRMKGDLDVHEFALALNSLIYFEATTHKKRMSYLKKVKINATQISENLKNGK